MRVKIRIIMKDINQIFSIIINHRKNKKLDNLIEIY